MIISFKESYCYQLIFFNFYVKDSKLSLIHTNNQDKYLSNFQHYYQSINILTKIISFKDSIDY